MMTVPSQISHCAAARRLLTAVAVLATLATTAGCAAGQRAHTAQELSVVDGIAAQAGSISVRAAGIIAPGDGNSYKLGSNADLQLVIVNGGRSSDRLTSVTSAVATSVVLSLSGADTSAGPAASDPAGSDSASATASDPANDPSSGTGGSQPPSATASISPSVAEESSAAATGAAGQSQTPIPLPAGQAVNVGYPGTAGSVAIVLQGLKTDLYPAQSVPVQFTFASGAVLTVSLGVKLSASGSAAPTLDTDPTAAG